MCSSHRHAATAEEAAPNACVQPAADQHVLRQTAPAENPCSCACARVLSSGQCMLWVAMFLVLGWPSLTRFPLLLLVVPRVLWGTQLEEERDAEQRLRELRRIRPRSAADLERRLRGTRPHQQPLRDSSVRSESATEVRSDTRIRVPRDTVRATGGHVGSYQVVAQRHLHHHQHSLTRTGVAPAHRSQRSPRLDPGLPHTQELEESFSHSPRTAAMQQHIQQQTQQHPQYDAHANGETLGDADHESEAVYVAYAPPPSLPSAFQRLPPPREAPHVRCVWSTQRCLVPGPR